MPSTEWPTAVNDRHRQHPFYPPAEVTLPKVYDQENLPLDDQIIHLHYMTTPGIVSTEELGSTKTENGVTVTRARINICPPEATSHWYITEANPNEDLAFGWTCLNGWTDCAELGYISLTEIENVAEVVRDPNWRPTPIRDANLPGYRPTQTDEAEPDTPGLLFDLPNCHPSSPQAAA